MSPPNAGIPDRGMRVLPSSWRELRLDLVRGVLPVAIVAASLGVYFVFGHRPPPERRPAEATTAADVLTAPVEAFHGTIDLAVEGVVKPFRHLTLAAEVAGRIRHKARECQEATYLTKGTLLFEIDPTDYELAVQRISRQLEQANQVIAEWKVERNNIDQQIKLAEEDVALAGREVKRLEGLAAGISTATELDQARRAELLARNNLLTLSNQRRMLDARYERTETERDLRKVLLQRAERDLSRTKVVAPCDGTVVTENVEEDGYVRQGESLVVINDTSAGEVVCQVELDDLFWLWGTKGLPEGENRDAADTSGNPADPDVGLANQSRSAASGQSAEVPEEIAEVYSFPSWPATIEFPFQELICEWDGQWVRFGGTGIDLSTRTVPCQVLVANPRRGRLRDADGTPVDALPPPPLTTGMFVTVRSRVIPFMPLLTIPAAGLRPGATVWLIRDGRLLTVPVRVARRTTDRVLVHADRDGMRDGDRVVTSPLAFVQDGMPVREISLTEASPE